MLPRERVIQVIKGGKPDRIPLYGWVKGNLTDKLIAGFGTPEGFEDHYEFDLAHLFGGPNPYIVDDDYWKRKKAGEEIEPPEMMDLPLCDPDAMELYEPLKEQLRHHKEQRGRFVYVQTPGIFEAINSTFGIENHLAYLLMFEEELHVIYRRQAEWNRRFAMNCLDIGIDMIHISDDWGGQQNLMFSPEIWWRMIHPYHKMTCDAVKQRGGFLSLHSDGNINAVVDGIIDLGFDVVHPWQESAGMSLLDFKEKWRGRFTVMGGLDVQTTIGFGKYDLLESEIERVMRMFADGGLLFCTTHSVQDHCSLDELKFAFDLAYRLAREVCAGKSGTR